MEECLNLTNLQKRILVSAIYFPALLLSANDGRIFSIFITIILGCCWHEYLSFKSKPRSNPAWVDHGVKIFYGILPTLAMATGYISLELAIATLLVILGIYIIRGLQQSQSISEMASSLSFLTLGFIYLTIPFTAMTWIQSRPSGREAIWFLFFVVAITDTAAYFWGRQFGRTPFFQNISPSKTKEGFYAGLVGAVVMAVLFQIVFSLNSFNIPNLLLCILLGAALGYASVFGDLFESLMKRSYGLKDSGTMVPGHGGVLDRFDGVIFASIALLFFVALRGGFR